MLLLQVLVQEDRVVLLLFQFIHLPVVVAEVLRIATPQELDKMVALVVEEVIREVSQDVVVQEILPQ